MEISKFHHGDKLVGIEYRLTNESVNSKNKGALKMIHGCFRHNANVKCELSIGVKESKLLVSARNIAGQNALERIMVMMAPQIEDERPSSHCPEHHDVLPEN